MRQLTPTLHQTSVTRLVDIALQEDIGMGDVTAEAVFDEYAPCRASFIAKQDGIICGLPIAQLVFERLDAEMQDFEERPVLLWTAMVQDGAFVQAGTVIACVEGAALVLLKGERTALNFLQRMSGVATLTRCYVQAIDGTKAQVCDTRKTLPGWRILDKYAVSMGGGTNHRFGLYDMAMIKDNHRDAAGSITEALKRCNQRIAENIPIEVETRTLDDVREVLRCIDEGLRVERIMFDNYTPDDVRKAVQLLAGRSEPIQTEASGGITLANIRKYAETGVNFISVGALTHSASAIDISMKFVLPSKV